MVFAFPWPEFEARRQTEAASEPSPCGRCLIKEQALRGNAATMRNPLMKS
jgi:hypothetical protein